MEAYQIKSLASAEFYIWKSKAMKLISDKEKLKILLLREWNEVYCTRFPEDVPDRRLIEAIGIAKQRQVYIDEQTEVPAEIDGTFFESQLL